MKEIQVNLDLLEKLRNEHGYSISHVSERLGYKTPTGYWLIEKGERKVSVTVLYKLANMYGVAMESLLKINE